MNRFVSTLLTAALFLQSALYAQTAPPRPPQPQPEKPKAGTIVDTPGTGRITDAPLTQTPAPAPAPASQTPATDRPVPTTGMVIERFEAVGNTSVASDTIRVYLGIAPGQPYDAAALQRNFHNLWQTGLFDDIKLEADRGDTGVVVRAIVRERPRIGSVEYRGNKELQTAKITEALEKEKIDLHVGNTVEQTLVRRAAEAIKRAYTENGFEGVAVDTLMEDMTEPGEKRIVFRVNEGIKAKVADIDFVGNNTFSDRRLRGQMKEVKEHNIITWIRKKNLYIPSKFDEDLERVKNFYQDHGYQDITFGEPQITTVGTAKKPRVKVTIPIKEGTVHTFGEVTVSGNKTFTNEQMIGEWPLKKGETIRRKPIQTRADAFGDAYRMRGFIYAYVEPEYVEKDGNVVDVHFRVFEGEQFRLGRLEFQGNTTTKDKVLRREIFLEEGQIMDMETFKQSIYKLGQLGYFKVNDNPDFKVNQESKTVDITVKGIEEGKNDIQFGGGYSEGGGFFLQSQFATRNFLGEGESFSLSYQHGRRTNYFTLSYADPWFMDTPNSFGVSLYNRNTIYPQSFGYESRGRGGTIAYGYRLGRFDSFSLVYGLERAKIHYESQAVPDINGNLPVSTITDATFTNSALVPTYRYDSRDNPYDTTRGLRFNAGMAYSGGPLGGTIDMIKPTVSATRFFRMSRKSSVSMNIDLGYIHPLSSDCTHTYKERQDSNKALCIPEAERFFTGGEYSVRGFRYGSLGPHESLEGAPEPVPTGGYKYQVYNLEYITKISEPLRLVFFADAGWAYGYKENVDFGKLRYSTGAELRIFLPVFQFPLRFIYAFNPDKRADDHFEAFQFTIGNTF